jgi:hypothetical protein
MKYLKRFNEQEVTIKDWCRKFKLIKYYINTDGSVDVNNNVNLYNLELEKLPIKFGKVGKKFNCADNLLTTLKGSPVKIGLDFFCGDNKLKTLKYCQIKKCNGDFTCHDNQLKSLSGCPEIVKNNFICSSNKIKTLVGGPSEVLGMYNCSNNLLTNLEGCPEKIGRYFDCSNNKLISLEGIQSNYSGRLYCNGNNVCLLYDLFDNLDQYLLSLDYGYLRGTNISKKRFEWACKDVGIKMPEYVIPGYKYIN